MQEFAAVQNDHARRGLIVCSAAVEVGSCGSSSIEVSKSIEATEGVRPSCLSCYDLGFFSSSHEDRKAR